MSIDPISLINLDKALPMTEGDPEKNYPILIFNDFRPGDAVLIAAPSHARYRNIAWKDGERLVGSFLTPHLPRKGEYLTFSVRGGDVTIPMKDARWAPLNREHWESKEPTFTKSDEEIGKEHSEYMDKLQSHLHRLGEEMGWCRQFDEILEEAGLESRERDMRAKLSVDFTGSISYPSSTLDVEMSREIEEPEENDSLRVDQINFEATIEVWIDTRCHPSEEPDFESEQVENALRDQLNCGIEDVNDWQLIETEEID